MIDNPNRINDYFFKNKNIRGVEREFPSKEKSRGRPAWSTARGSGPRPLEVRGFKSHPLHEVYKQIEKE